MEDSTSLVERSRNKFYETKNKVNAKLGDHLSRSRSLVSDVNRSLRKSMKDDSSHSQRYFVESFLPFKENSHRDHFRSSNSDAFRCNTRMTSPTFMSKNNSALGLSETPRHMTQAMWLLNTSNITCNLSNNMVEDEQEKIPEILLKDPAELLKGEDKTSEVKCEDKLTELLKDNNYDKDESNTVQADSNNSISYDIVSSLDFSKKTVDNNSVYGSNELVNKLLNESYNNMEDLTHLFNSTQNSFSNLYNSWKNYNWTGGQTNLSKLDEMFTEEFVNSSGIDFQKQSDELTQTLLKLNEHDKLKETELAPKVFTNEENEKKRDKELKRVQFTNVPSAGRETTTGLETDLLGNFTIIRDDKTGRKMYRLSDFDQKFKTSSKSSNSVQVQTDLPEPEPVVNKRKYNTNVKVVYQNAFEGKNDLTSRVKSFKKQDLYAQKIVSNLVPKLEMKLQQQQYYKKECVMFEEPIKPEFDVVDKVKQYKEQLKANEAEKMNRWRAQRQPIYNTMDLNLKSGVRGYTMCRGGSRNSRVVHNPKWKVASHNEHEVEDLSYISPSNRKSIEVNTFYGYERDEDEVPRVQKLHSNWDKDTQKLPKSSIGDKWVRKTTLNPVDHFEEWWSANTRDLNMIREQLSM